MKYWKIMQFRMVKNGRQQGFTLIELMVVVAIIAILASIAFPSYQDSVRKSRRTEARELLLNAAQALERHYTNTNSYADLNINKTGSFYDVAMETSSPSTSYELKATAKGDQLKDTACKELTLTNVGVKTPAGCW